MNKIVSDLQDYGKQIIIKTVKVDLNNIIMNILSTNKVPEKINVIVNIPSGFTIDADPENIRRVSQT